MKIDELTIESIRGLLQVDLHPNGRNLLVWGPNGAGKSGVVDAIDFLFSGDIARLHGDGTQKLNLLTHGHHVLRDSGDASVSAVVRFGNDASPVKIQRKMKPNRNLRVPSDIGTKLDPILSLADKEQLCLTRRDILRFIASEGSGRATRVQALLNLRGVEDTRKAIVTAKNKIETSERTEREFVDRAKIAIADHVEVEEFGYPSLSKAVQERRAVFGGGTLDDLTSLNMDSEISLPDSKAAETQFDPRTALRETVAVITSVDVLQDKNLSQSESVIRQSCDRIEKDPRIRQLMTQRELLEIGLELIDDDTDRCPLCDKSWELKDLLEHLQEKRQSVEDATELKKLIDTAAQQISGHVKVTTDRIERLIGQLERAPEDLKLSRDAERLRTWCQQLQNLLNVLESAEQDYLEMFPKISDYVATLTPSEFKIDLDQLQATLAAAPLPSNPVQVAWDWITTAKVRLKSLENAEFSSDAAILTAQRARLLEQEYEVSRNDVLGGLYERVSNRFSDLYVKLHPHAAGEFSVELLPDQASLDLAVGFDDGKMYPANAVHSEGHQDSMGLCLFLALREELHPAAESLMVLDDVVMSVDSGHRRYLCELLKSEFAETQIVITTHDRVWARQLVRLGVVDPRNSIRFTRWSLSGGPNVDNPPELWKEIENALEADLVPDAAHKLRRASEEYFDEVCDALKAPVPYDSLGEHDLGDLLLPGMARFKSLLARASRAAESWDQDEKVKKIAELNDRRSEINSGLNEEWWTVNSEVHFSRWYQLDSSELKPIVDTMKLAHDLFQCQLCQSMLSVSHVENKEKALECSCGNVSLNLEMAPQSA